MANLSRGIDTPIKIGNIIEFLGETTQKYDQSYNISPDNRDLVYSIYTDPSSDNDESYIPNKINTSFIIDVTSYLLPHTNNTYKVNYDPYTGRYFATPIDDDDNPIGNEQEVIFHNIEFEFSGYTPDQERDLTSGFLKNYVREWYSSLSNEEKTFAKEFTRELELLPLHSESDENVKIDNFTLFWIRLLHDPLINEYVNVVNKWDDNLDYITDISETMFYDFDYDDDTNIKILFLLSEINKIVGSPMISVGYEIIPGLKAARYFANEYTKVKGDYMSLLQPNIKAART